MLEIIRLNEVTNVLHYSRLDCLRILAKQGFVMTLGCGRALFPEAALEFPQQAVLRSSKLYWACLILRSEIFARGAPCVYHVAPSTYYKALLTLENLQSLHAIEAEVSKVGKLNIQPLQDLMSSDHNCKPLVDACDDDGVDGLPPDPQDCDGDDGDDCDGNADPTGASSALVALPVNTIKQQMAVPESCYDSISSTYVHFDNCSHSSGLLRGYIKCSNTGHGHCWKYTQVATRGSRKHTIAVLTAWSVWGKSLLDKTDHIRRDPPEHMVAEVLARLSHIHD